MTRWIPGSSDGLYFQLPAPAKSSTSVPCHRSLVLDDQKDERFGSRCVALIKLQAKAQKRAPSLFWLQRGYGRSGCLFATPTSGHLGCLQEKRRKSFREGEKEGACNVKISSRCEAAERERFSSPKQFFPFYLFLFAIGIGLNSLLRVPSLTGGLGGGESDWPHGENVVSVDIVR